MIEMNKCFHLDELISVEIETIKEHLNNHKWYQHIQDDKEAMNDFIQHYGQYMREVYCSSVCLDRFKCCIAEQQYIIEPHSNEPINISLRKFYNNYIREKHNGKT